MLGPRAWRRGPAGFVLLLLVLAPLTLWRAHLETNLWVDETYSLLLTTYPAGEIVARTALDAHPPGYYLALKAWLKAARLAGSEPGVLWARLLNVLLWGGLAAAAWFGGRRLVGRRAGALLAWVVAGGACAAWLARDLRGHGAASVFLFGAYLALVALAAPPASGGAGHAGEPLARRRAWMPWCAYAACAALALWTHLLSALVLAALSLAWITFVAISGRLDRSTLGLAALANLASALLFAPWLARIGGQIGYLERSDPQWMTPPTLENLGWVVSFWYPLGRLGDPAAAGNRLLVVLGLAAVLVPVLVGVVLAWRSRPTVVKRGAAATTPCHAALGAGASIGLAGAALYVLAIWLLDRLGLVHTFHGPRYPALAVHLWVAGLVSLVAWVAARCGARFRWAVVALAPWLVASGVGQVLAARQDAWGALSELRAAAGPAWPSAGEPLYVMPPELLAFYRSSLAELDLRRIERLPCEGEAGASAAVLDVSSWPELDRARDHLVRAAIGRRQLGAKVRRVAHPQPPDRGHLALYRIERLDGILLGELCRRGVQPPIRDLMAGSVSEGLPARQLSPQHWSYLEVSPELEVYRWSRDRRTPVVFDRPLAAGEYTLHVVGHHPSGPEVEGAVGFTLEEAGLAAEEELPGGRFHACIEVTWPGGGGAPRLVLEHPLWRTGAPGDPARRRLGFLFYGAWFTPAGDGTACGTRLAPPGAVRSIGAQYWAVPARRAQSRSGNGAGEPPLD